jgi:hypothetical protein
MRDGPPGTRRLHRRDAVRLGALGAASLSLSSLLGCAGGYSLVPIQPKKRAVGDIDADPIALLPPRVLVYVSVDLQPLYATSLGADVAPLIQSIVPLGAESNFMPVRDTTKLVGGVYAMQGVDFLGVLQGRFDVASITRAADARAAAPSGAEPLVKSRYGDRDIYTSSNTGFTLLSAHTMLCGSEVAMRRAIDRLRYGTVRRDVPAWMISVAETQGASFALVGDFGADAAFLGVPPKGAKRMRRQRSTPAVPVLRASSVEFPFLGDLRAMRVVGNFAPPDLNFAGTLSYSAPENAARGADSLRNVSKLAQWATMFALGGLPPINVAVSGNDVGFVQPIDSNIARSLFQLVRS